MVCKFDQVLDQTEEKLLAKAKGQKEKSAGGLKVKALGWTPRDEGSSPVGATLFSL